MNVSLLVGYVIGCTIVVFLRLAEKRKLGDLPFIIFLNLFVILSLIMPD